MYLLINLSEKDNIQLTLFNTENIEHKTSSGRNRELLISIDQFLTEQNLTKSDVEGIMVVVGSGGFTSTRIAVVVANTFAYTLQIPLLAIQESEVGDAPNLIPKLLEQPKGHYISAEYSGEPNIGTKKSQK